ncbi:rhodanese-like domain-containing protein [Myxococcota bacterium]|nr:rhodanese-like domain-containing protein [Myxococcota bacterium]MBU1383178.1 rhodanese-like domain-containing protein [Myxococcota bacterium]MBU1497186.1 rhodanese-like domain-containing protein [Myxococcota bacterium]
MRKIYSLILLLFLTISCSGKTEKIGDSVDCKCLKNQVCKKGKCSGIGYISAFELKKSLGKKDFVLINVLDFDAGTIPQTDAKIHFNDRAGFLKFLGNDKERKIIVYCRTIPKAKKAAKLLSQEGYTNVSILDGGITAWKKLSSD